MKVETNLYSAVDGRLLWSGQSETINPRDGGDLIDSYIRAMVAQLARERLIP